MRNNILDTINNYLNFIDEYINSLLFEIFSRYKQEEIETLYIG